MGHWWSLLKCSTNSFRHYSLQLQPQHSFNYHGKDSLALFFTVNMGSSIWHIVCHSGCRWVNQLLHKLIQIITWQFIIKEQVILSPLHIWCVLFITRLKEMMYEIIAYVQCNSLRKKKGCFDSIWLTQFPTSSASLDTAESHCLLYISNSDVQSISKYHMHGRMLC